MPRLGGTKNPKRHEIVALQPDLVLFNKEENRRVDIDWLAEQGVPLFGSFPHSPQQALADIAALIKRLGMDSTHGETQRVQKLSARIENLIARPQPEPPATFFVAIWKSPWMTANGDTYISSLLELSGARNVFGARRRRFPLAFELGLTSHEDSPGDQDTRYPRLNLAELALAHPDIIVFPSEPYPFSPAHVAEILSEPALADVPAVRHNRVTL